jgi:uncharacterized tellurite resistance protein B-like protein
MASILTFLGFTSGPESTDSDSIQPIAAALDQLDAGQARYVASFAFVLSRLAAADETTTPAEAHLMERLVQENGDLPAEQAALVVEMATRQQRLFGATDDFLVTRELQQRASYEQRFHLVECLFALAAADLRIRPEEGDEIGRIARELRIEPADVSRLRNQHLPSRPILPS